MKRKKITAILLASLMGISAVPATTWAADSYKETEKVAFAKMIEEFGKCGNKGQSGRWWKSNSGNAFSCGYLLAGGCFHQWKCKHV